MTGAPVHLGELLAFGQRSSADLAAWLSGADRDLGARLEEEAALRRESLSQFVRVAVADFLAEADEEAWASLISSARNAPDPGVACVQRMTAFRLELERST